LELMHSDVCKLMKTTSHGGAWNFVTFIDDFSKKTHVYLLKAKGEVFDKFKAYANSKPWWKIKPTWRSNPCDPIMEENLCPKILMIFCVNVESNDKQVHLTHHNKMELWNEPIGPSWNALKTWFVHKDLAWNFGLKQWTWQFISRIYAELKLLIKKPHKKHGLEESLMYPIWEFSVAKHMRPFLMKE
jgi:hypothetical protein